MNLNYSRDTRISELREYRRRLRAQFAGEIPLCPDRDWTYNLLEEEPEEETYDGLTVREMDEMELEI